MNRTTESDQPAAGSGIQASAETAECNCPDGCERDHDND
jgi:hypothetical protein